MIVAVTALGFGQSKGTQPRKDNAEARIRKIIADQVSAWNVGDEKAFSRSFAADGRPFFTDIRRLSTGIARSSRASLKAVS